MNIKQFLKTETQADLGFKAPTYLVKSLNENTDILIIENEKNIFSLTTFLKNENKTIEITKFDYYDSINHILDQTNCPTTKTILQEFFKIMLTRNCGRGRYTLQDVLSSTSYTNQYEVTLDGVTYESDTILELLEIVFDEVKQDVANAFSHVGFRERSEKFYYQPSEDSDSIYESSLIELYTSLEFLRIIK
jgi:hypothetical protein